MLKEYNKKKQLCEFVLKFLSGWFIHSCFLIIHNSNKRMSSSSFANDTLSSINIWGTWAFKMGWFVTIRSYSRRLYFDSWSSVIAVVSEWILCTARISLIYSSIYWLNLFGRQSRFYSRSLKLKNPLIENISDSTAIKHMRKSAKLHDANVSHCTSL